VQVGEARQESGSEAVVEKKCVGKMYKELSFPLGTTEMKVCLRNREELVS